MSPTTPQLLTLAEVAGELRTSIDWVRRRIWAEELAAYRVGGVLRVSRPDLDDFLRRCRENPLRPLKKRQPETLSP
jgi:excisionase family DNA binding protein